MFGSTYSGNIIADPFPALIDREIQALLGQVDNARFKLYVIGYAQFFNPTTTQCENVSFHFWGELPENQRNLTSALRTTMNGLATSLNTQISDAVDRANEKDERNRWSSSTGTQPLTVTANAMQVSINLISPTRTAGFRRMISSHNLRMGDRATL